MGELRDPARPEGTLERVTGGTMRVGITENEELMTELEERRLDLAVGGLVEDDPWSTKVAFAVPTEELLARIEDATESLRRLDWRLHRLVIVPRSEIPDDDRLG